MLNTLRNALPIVAAALGRKFGVEVGVGGHDACTDGRRIQIPDVPDDPASRDLAWGYLAHEAGHVRYTDFGVYEQAARESPLQEILQNRIEDVRIERELARPYPGTRATITAVLRRMLAEGRVSAPEPSDHPAQVLAAYLLLALRHEVLGQDVLAEEAREAANSLQQVFPAPFIARLRTLIDEVPRLTRTAEAVDLARHIRRLVEDEATASCNLTGQPLKDQNDDSPNPQSGDGEPEPDSGSPAERNRKPETSTGADEADIGDAPAQGSGRNSKPAERHETPAPADGNGQDEPAPAQDGSTGNRNDDSEEHDGDGARDRQDASPGTDAAGQGEDAPGGCAENAAATDSADQRDALAAVLTASEADCDGDLFTEVGKLLGTDACATNEIRLPLPEDDAGDALAGMRLLARVQAESARLSARLQGLVQASRMDRPRPVRSGRRLDPRRLHRVAVADERVFARKTHRIAPNTAVHLLVDLSGSMHAKVDRRDGTLTTRAGSALESALALALALDGIAGVTVAVTAFPGRTGTPDRVTRMIRHGQSPRACAGAFIQAPRGGTPMAQALWYAAADLLACREERRLMMVLTDGEPDDPPAVLRLLTLCRQAGIETVGVGIGISVGHLFPTAIEVTEAKDLKRELFGVAERLLVGAAA